MHLILKAVAALAFFLSIGASARAQNFTLVLKIDGINGTTADPNHAGGIDLLSYKAGVSQRALATQAGGLASPVSSDFKPLLVYKAVDITSPPLLLACATGQHFKKATLTLSKPTDTTTGYTFFTIVLSDVVIGSVNEDSDVVSQNDGLVESVSLSYSKIQWTFTPQNPDGSNGTPVTGGFDVRANRPFRPPTPPSSD